jgi:hypothetical protein
MFQSFSFGERSFLTGMAVDKYTYRPKRPGAPSQPYYFAFLIAVSHALNKAKAGKIVHFMFDQQQQLAGRALQLMAMARGNMPDELKRRLGQAIFDSRQRMPLLRSADLIAHLFYSFMTRPQTLSLERRYAISKLATRWDQSGMKIVDLAGTEKWLNDLARPRPGLRESLRSLKPRSTR